MQTQCCIIIAFTHTVLQNSYAAYGLPSSEVISARFAEKTLFSGVTVQLVLIYGTKAANITGFVTFGHSDVKCCISATNKPERISIFPRDISPVILLSVLD